MDQIDDPVERAQACSRGAIEFLKSAPGLQFLPDPDGAGNRLSPGAPTSARVVAAQCPYRPQRRWPAPRSRPGARKSSTSSTLAIRYCFRLVDMPGYGFAKAPLKDLVQQVEAAGPNDFLRGRVVLKRTLLLIDSRHGPKAGRSSSMMEDARRGGRQLSASS